MKLARVGLDVPLGRTFDYRADGDAVAIGARVVVPFGRRSMIGVVLGIGEDSDLPLERIKSITRVLDAPRLGNDDLRLLRFAADYYHYPLGQVVMNALPQRLKRIRA